MSKLKYRIVFCVSIISFMLLVLSGCAIHSVHQKRGEEYFQAGEYDSAVEYLEKALKEKPGQELRLKLFRAKLNSYFLHVARARKLKEVDKKEEAVKEYNIALNIFPNNKKLIDEVNNYLNPPTEQRDSFRSNIRPPVSLNIDASEKMDLRLRNTPITKIFNVVGKSYGVNFIFDKDFRDFVYSIDSDSIGFYDILNQLCMIGSAEYRVLDTSSVLIYPNTTFKKRTFGLRGVKIFYLSNVKADDAKKLLMTVFRDQQIQAQEDKNLNSIIIKAEYSTLVEIEKFIYNIDRRKSEVIIDVQILEVTKGLSKALGTTYGSTDTPPVSIAAGKVGSEGGVSSTFNFNEIKDTNFFLTIPSAALNFLESDSKSRSIAKPNLRGVDGEEIKFMVGDEVPVPQTQFQAGAAGGFSNIPVTSYQYKNVGVDVKMTPYVHHDNEVTLEIKLTINSIAKIQDGFPTFGKRELENVIRLKEGETNIIGGFIKDEMRGSLQGISALSRIPVLGRLFGATGKEISQTDLIFSVTPRVIRAVSTDSAETSTIWSNAQTGAPGEVRESGEAPPPEAARSEGDSVLITPNKRRIPAGSVSYFTIRLNTRANLSSLAIGGSISGGKAEIEEIKTDFFGGKKVQVLENHSGSSFDLGFTFPDAKTRVNVVAQLKVKFIEKGNYTINFGTVSALSEERQAVELSPQSAEVEVY